MNVVTIWVKKQGFCEGRPGNFWGVLGVKFH